MGSIPASSTTQDTATLCKQQDVAVFLCPKVSYGVVQFTPISHVIHTRDHRTLAMVVLGVAVVGRIFCQILSK